jgi:hypothetical protein
VGQSALDQSTAGIRGLRDSQTNRRHTVASSCFSRKPFGPAISHQELKANTGSFRDRDCRIRQNFFRGYSLNIPLYLDNRCDLSTAEMGAETSFVAVLSWAMGAEQNVAAGLCGPGTFNAIAPSWWSSSMWGYNATTVVSRGIAIAPWIFP